MAMSYMKAWKLVKGMDDGFIEPLVKKSRGGQKRGGAVVTPTGRQVLALYRKMESASQSAIRCTAPRFKRLLK